MTAHLRTLPDWLSFISAQHPKEIALGLERVAEVAARMKLLPLAPRQLIVAGTNGKGSTARFTEALLLAQGYSVGLTMSPHLHRYNERVRINGEDASDQVLVDAFVAVEAARGDIPLTYYEYSVLGAFWLFKRAQLDACVLEVGLGGRLDATNIVDAEVAAVTSIGLDHQNFLGDTLELIGAEKAAVCRAGNPLLLGAPMPDSVTRVARQTGARIQSFGEHFWYQQTADELTLRLERGAVSLRCSSTPRIALRNVALATACTAKLTRAPTDAELAAAVRNCRHPGRFEIFEFRQRTLVVDVAHNPASAAFLRRQLRSRWPQRRIVACCGILADKDVQGIVEALGAEIAHWVFVPTRGGRGLAAEAAAERAQRAILATSERSGPQRSREQSEAAATKFRELSCSVAADVASGLDKAHAMAGEADIIVAFGSFQQVQHVREILLPETVA